MRQSAALGSSGLSSFFRLSESVSRNNQPLKEFTNVLNSLSLGSPQEPSTMPSGKSTWSVRGSREKGRMDAKASAFPI